MGWSLIIETPFERKELSKHSFQFIEDLNDIYDEKKYFYEIAKLKLLVFSLIEKDKITVPEDGHFDSEVDKVSSIVSVFGSLLEDLEECYDELRRLEEIKMMLDYDEVRIHDESNNKYYIKDSDGNFIEVDNDEYEEYFDEE